MFDQYREREQQQRREFYAAVRLAWRSAPVWRRVSFLFHIVLAAFLTWAMDAEHSQVFWWSTAFIISALLIAEVRVGLWLQRRAGGESS